MKREVWRETPFGVKLLLTTSFLMNMGFYALIPYLTLYLTGSIGWALAMAGLVLSVRQFSQQGFAFIGGVAADAFGYKGTMVLGMAVRAIGFAMFAFCTETWHFFVAAILSGLGGALFDPAGSAAFAVLTPESIRKEVFAFRNVLTNIGVVGSQIIGTALSAVDFTYLSLFAGGIFGLCALVAFFLLPPISATSTRQSVWDSMLHVIKDRQFVRFTVILMGYYYLSNQIFLTIPLLVENVTHNKGNVGIVLSAVSVSVILLQMKVSHWMEGYSQRLTLIGVGTMIMGTGLFMLTFANSLWLLLLDVFLYALGTMIAVPNLVDVVPRFAPKELVGAYYGFNGYSIAIGGSVGQIAGGWVYDQSIQLEMAWLPWTICLLVGMVVAWMLYQMEHGTNQIGKDYPKIARS
ncbi:MDR family MFS transporter [Brevibacillus choshinensis]|uniref:MFS transporter n=1 Tax=Brevibacillus choshinensis TaxID=54911 RepID=A0ABX7FVB9_BRECH|nr:MFS transporter [Brevibacillus choshinensis]QRG69720.1 MFS transporter [Brevibacillus choshinensis]